MLIDAGVQTQVTKTHSSGLELSEGLRSEGDKFRVSIRCWLEKKAASHIHSSHVQLRKDTASARKPEDNRTV